MSEWSDRLPGYDEWRTREHNRLFWFEEEHVMDAREEEEKRDAEIRGFVESDDRTERRRIVYTESEPGVMHVLATVSMIEGRNHVQMDFREPGVIIDRLDWERLVYAVESLLPEGE